MSDDKEDLTRLEDLGEFLHQDDEETDKILSEDNEESMELSSFEDESTDESEDLSSFEDSDDSSSLDNTEGDSSDDTFASFDDDQESEFQDDSEEISSFDDNEESGFEEDSEELASFDDDHENNFEEDSDELASFDDDQENNFEEGSGELASFDDEESEFEEDSGELASFDDGQESEFEEDSGELASFDDNQESEFEELSSFDHSEEPESLTSFEDDSEGSIEEPEAEQLNEINSFDSEDDEIAEDPVIEKPSLVEECVETPKVENEVKIFQRHIQQNTFQAISRREKERQIKTRENFEKIQKIGSQSTTSGKVQVGGNPAYSIIIENIDSEKDVSDIIRIIKSYDVFSDEDIKQMNIAYQTRSIIVPQISEYTAILMANQFRKFSAKIGLGLAEEVNQHSDDLFTSKGMLSAKGYLTPEVKSGEVSPLSEVIMTSEPFLEKHQILRRQSFLYVHQIISSKTTRELKKLLDSCYLSLSQQIKDKAIKAGANAIINLKFDTVNLSRDSIFELKVTLYGLACIVDSKDDEQHSEI